MMEFASEETPFKNITNTSKSFMTPDFTQQSNIQKREDFAVSLRKMKTRQNVQEKRRKLAAHKYVQNAGHLIYSGLPEWRKENYGPQIEILRDIFSQLSGGQIRIYEHFDTTYDTVEKIQKLVQILKGSNLTNIQKLAILTKIRQELSQQTLIDNNHYTILIDNQDFLTLIFKLICS